MRPEICQICGPHEPGKCQHKLFPTDFNSIELRRLQGIEERFKRLATLVNLIEEYHPSELSVMIKVTRANWVSGKSWHEILKMAFDMNGDNK